MDENQDFKKGDRVKLALSGEKGHVLGTFDHAEQPPQFYVRYVDGRGCQTEGWFSAGALQARGEGE
jgi:hypothetical protein